ncbi:MAG: 3-phosphoshikimate 1-carboxyvinyltransferase [Gemmatimonadaceae bacterium]
MRVSGEVRPPGDKSISHRALLFAALADGISRVRGILDSADVRSTAGALRALGVDVPPLARDVVVKGVGLRGLRAPNTVLDCGNSGTSARLLAGVVAASSFAARFEGDASLSRRPMRRVARPLEAMGARFEFERGDGLPMTVHGGQLRGIHWTSETSSAQVKSAILLAGVVAGVEVSVSEPRRSRDHTERMLAARGVAVEGSEGCVRVRRTEHLDARDTDVPSDPSSAAFFAALAALASAGELTLRGVCVNPTRTGFFHVLREMGAIVDIAAPREHGGEPVADVRVRPAALRSVVVGADRVPALIDELPLLACVASRAEGETRITGAGELRVKESDRIAAVVASLRAIGATAEELSDGLVVQGSDRPLAGTVATHGDHRLAMAFAVLGALPGNTITVDDRACVAVSFPNFWQELDRVRGGERPVQPHARSRENG